MLEYLAKGETPKDVAERFGMPVGDMFTLLERVGNKLDPYRGRDQLWAQTELVKLYEMANGKSPRATKPTPGTRLRSRPGSSPRPVPKVVEDTPGEEFKPDPAMAHSMAELRQLLREYWGWAGELGSRRVAAASGEVFSHSTAAKLIAADPNVPLRQEYVAGMIRGCGGSEADQQAWITAFRRVRQATRAPRLKVVGQ